MEYAYLAQQLIYDVFATASHVHEILPGSLVATDVVGTEAKTRDDLLQGIER